MDARNKEMNEKIYGRRFGRFGQHTRSISKQNPWQISGKKSKKRQLW